jgi:hypothetical protein
MIVSVKHKSNSLYPLALEIRKLSEHISFYIREDLNTLDLNGKENDFIYFSGDIVQNSDSLIPEIIQAETVHSTDEKLKHAEAVKKFSSKLYSNCKQLENSNSRGIEFIKLLRFELKKFHKNINNWSLTL